MTALEVSKNHLFFILFSFKFSYIVLFVDTGDGHQVLLEVKCPESSVLKEKICFENADKETICLTLTCRVIPHHLGTPSLKDGVRLIHGSGGDMESDATDWKGFDE